MRQGIILNVFKLIAWSCAPDCLARSFREMMTERFIEDLVQCSVLHDIGKVAIPDSILFNPANSGLTSLKS